MIFGLSSAEFLLQEVLVVLRLAHEGPTQAIHPNPLLVDTFLLLLRRLLVLRKALPLSRLLLPRNRLPLVHVLLVPLRDLLLAPKTLKNIETPTSASGTAHSALSSPSPSTSLSGSPGLCSSASLETASCRSCGTYSNPLAFTPVPLGGVSAPWCRLWNFC